MSNFVKVGTKKDFPVNQTVGVEVNGTGVCIANGGGELTAFNDSCTHAFAMLSGSEIEEGNELMCPLHGARFNVKTGEALTLPAVRPLRMHDIKVEGNDVYVQLRPE